jgi:hypothetical protein
MCIAILNTKGTTLKKEILRNCWENNGDGAGMLYIDDDKKLSVFKEMTSFENFYKNYIDIKSKYGKRNIVLHFRISTHGKINETNCHPFLVSEDVGFVHNGMIYNVPRSNDFSDTYMFNESVLKNLKDGFEYNEIMLEMIEEFIGAGSKLVFLNSENDYAIVNEKAGHWHLGCWFSNTSYQQVNSWVDFGGIRKAKTSGSSGFRSSWGYGYGWSSYNDHYIPGAISTHTAETWKDDWDIADAKDNNNCKQCQCKLYGINEMERQLCTYCQEDEELLLQEEDMLIEDYGIGDCELCNDKTVAGIFRPEVNSWVCRNCARELGA